MADSNTGAETHKMSLKQTAVTESKEVFQKQNDGGMSRDTEANSEGTGNGQNRNSLSIRAR